MVPKNLKSKGIKKKPVTKKKTNAKIEKKPDTTRAGDANKKRNTKKVDQIPSGGGFTAYKSLLDIPVTDIDGRQHKAIRDLVKGKKLLLVVNVASKCGLTKKTYTQLGALYKQYQKQGLEILAFPCNQFASQEPGSREQIKAFARVTQSTTFPLLDKVAVNGPNAHEVFKFLRFHSELNNGDSVGHIHWNFGKFLVDPATMAVSYFNPREDPQNLEFAVATCLQ